MNIPELIDNGIASFFASFFDNAISYFSNILVDVMSTSQAVLEMELVVSGMLLAQALALSLLVIKVMFEAFQTYHLYQNGDPEADPSGLLVRTGQAVAIILSLPWIVTEIFKFGTHLSHDVASISAGTMQANDWKVMSQTILATGGSVVAIMAIIVVLMLLIIALQAAMRGAELALMAVIGPIMALNLTANNRSVWSAWFKQLVIICTAQALQIFMLKGAMSLFTINAGDSNNMLLIIGWLWVTVKTPKFIQQFVYSTGFTGSVAGGAKQASSMYLMRKMMTKA